MKVGFIGLGNVGGKLSGSLLRNEIDLMVHDLNQDLVNDFVSRGAERADGPASMMRDCDVVITCLPSPAASAAVMDEMLPEVKEGKIWMEMSTTDEAEVKRLGDGNGAGRGRGGLPGVWRLSSRRYGEHFDSGGLRSQNL